MKPQAIAFSCRVQLTGTLLNQPVVLHLSFHIPNIHDFGRAGQVYELAASISFPASLCTFCGYKGEMFLYNPAHSAKEVQFQFQTDMEGKPFLVTGSAALTGNYLAEKGKKATVQVYAGSLPKGNPLYASSFRIKLVDWLYLRKSLSPNNASPWCQEKKTTKSLENYFFSKN